MFNPNIKASKSYYSIECHRPATPIGQVMRATLLTHPNNTLLGSSWGAVMFRHVRSLDLVVGTKLFMNSFMLVFFF